MNSQFDVLHSATFSRRPIDEKLRLQDNPVLIQSNHNTLPGALAWRILSSDIVARQNKISVVQDNGNGRAQVVPQIDKMEKLPKFCLSDPLNTPIKRQSKQTTNNSDGSRMTKTCEKMFSQIMRNNTPRRKIDADPSQSVRKIIKSSGLLPTFGTGYLEESFNPSDCEQLSPVRAPHDGTLSSISFSNFQQENSNVHAVPPSPQSAHFTPKAQSRKVTFAPSSSPETESLASDPIPLYYETYAREHQNLNYCSLPSESDDGSPYTEDAGNVREPSDSNPPHFNESPDTGGGAHHRTPASQFLTQQFSLRNTIVLQKTVETKLVEYEEESTTSSAGTHPRAKPMRRKRPKRSERRGIMSGAKSGYDPSSESDDGNSSSNGTNQTEFHIRPSPSS